MHIQGYIMLDSHIHYSIVKTSRKKKKKRPKLDKFKPKCLTTMPTTVIERCRVAPPPGAVAEQSLPLTFFDMTWLHFRPMLHLRFYEFPCSKAEFVESEVPKLKKSLSITLKHFFPYSSNLIYPLSREKMPEFHYMPGDSVSFTVAEASDDFDDLVGNRAKSADRLYSFVPILPTIVEESDRKISQVFAAQVTLFPGRGVGIGIATHHAVGDAVSCLAFITKWASINKRDEDEDENEELNMVKKDESLPIFDRSVVKYPSQLDSIYWEQAQKIPLESWHPSLPTNRMRSTFIFSPTQIKEIKGLIQAKISDSIQLSSFVTIAAYMWTGLAKSLRAAQVVDEDPTFFIIPVDLRQRLDPPVPSNYCGNCISYGLARIRLRDLAGDEGLFRAAEALAAGIKKRMNNENILECAEIWSPEIGEGVKKPFFAMTGSSKLDFYGTDFGWGKARKQEILSNDYENYAMTLCKSRDFDGGVEVCMSLPMEEMEAFDAYISQGIIKA